MRGAVEVGEQSERPGDRAEGEVVGAEVVPPLRDAVRLVDHEQADPGAADAVQEPGRREPLGRDVEQARPPGHRAVHRRPVRRGVLLRVDQRDLARRDALERLDLVLHQRHQRRDHQRQVRAHQRRQLVAERLARAGRHHDHHVAVRQRGLARLALPGPEGREAEERLERCGQVHGRKATLAPSPEGTSAPSQSCYERTTASSSSANFPFAAPVRASG